MKIYSFISNMRHLYDMHSVALQPMMKITKDAVFERLNLFNSAWEWQHVTFPPPAKHAASKYSRDVNWKWCWTIGEFNNKILLFFASLFCKHLLIFVCLKPLPCFFITVNHTKKFKNIVCGTNNTRHHMIILPIPQDFFLS